MKIIFSAGSWITRHRSLFLFGGSAVAGWLSYDSDPDNGHSTYLALVAILQGIWALAISHWGRKAMTSYRSKAADMEALFLKAKESPVGAGLALIALSIMFYTVTMVFAPRAHAGELPPGFAAYGPVLKSEQRRLWLDHPDPAVLAALVEQESCVSLKSPRCWNPKASLKAAREEGAGMGQVTRAFRADGSLRFDALADLRARYRAEMGELSWDNVYTRPDLQLRGIVLMSRDAVHPFRTAGAMLAFGDAAYNGGPGDLMRERRACKMTPGCDPGQWFGNVERHCVKSRQPLYGGRSACDINREHVRNVLLVRREKYVAFFKAPA
jgi:hypothetical protein